MLISEAIKLLQKRMDITGDMEVEIVNIRKHSVEHFELGREIEFHCKGENCIWAEWKIKKAGE